jgi:hypothetical protein
MIPINHSITLEQVQESNEQEAGDDSDGLLQLQQVLDRINASQAQLSMSLEANARQHGLLEELLAKSHKNKNQKTHNSSR